jgi:SAM-dependent methyltransferase
MSVFDAYARYYDLLYRDKDYAQEADFIQRLLQTHAPTAQRLLELGSGTGRHAEHLAEQGYHITGVERSAEMLARCSQRQAHQPSAIAQRLSFLQGDLREVRLDQTFDAVLSLFHVISYQTSNADLAAAFKTVALHLKPGGVFIFDVWYGPAVLHDLPQVRVKRLHDDDLAITRIAEPVAPRQRQYCGCELPDFAAAGGPNHLPGTAGAAPHAVLVYARAGGAAGPGGAKAGGLWRVAARSPAEPRHLGGLFRGG